MAYHSTTAILPAAKVLFDKNKVTLAEIASMWNDGTIVVCRQPNGQLHFIYGASGNYYKPGDVVGFHHDQSFAHLGDWTVVNQIHFITRNGEPHFSYDVVPVLGVSLASKAGLHVFK